MRRVFELFNSLRTAVWLLVGLIVFLLAGSLIMPARPDRYGAMNSQLLFEWLAAEWRNPVHFWFLMVLVLLALVTLNTLVCSVDSVLRRLTRREFLLRISPQLMHVGFLLILLAHLLSSGWGFKAEGVLPKGASGVLPTGQRVTLRTLDMDFYASGMPRSWWADVELTGADGERASGRIGPNRPLFHKGVGVYLKNPTMVRNAPAAQIYVAADPGALWALAGALVFTLGNGIVLVLRVRGGN